MSQFNFIKIIASMPQKKKEVLGAMANEAKNYFVGSWKRQGFDGQPWQKRKNETKKTKGKAILVGRGTLRRAVNNSLKSVTDGKTVFSVDMPKGEQYPKYLNEGTDKMVARPFMKNSKELNDILMKKIEVYIKNIWQT